jgi:hypothetical protein
VISNSFDLSLRPDSRWVAVSGDRNSSPSIRLVP